MEKVEKEGFSRDGGARGVARETHRRQTTLLEEARDQTVSHSLTCEFQRWTEDQRMSAWGEVCFDEASTRV